MYKRILLTLSIFFVTTKGADPEKSLQLSPSGPSLKRSVIKLGAIGGMAGAAVYGANQLGINTSDILPAAYSTFSGYVPSALLNNFNNYPNQWLKGALAGTLGLFGLVFKPELTVMGAQVKKHPWITLGTMAGSGALGVYNNFYSMKDMMHSLVGVTLPAATTLISDNRNAFGAAVGLGSVLALGTRYWAMRSMPAANNGAPGSRNDTAQNLPEPENPLLQRPEALKEVPNAPVGGGAGVAQEPAAPLRADSFDDLMATRLPVFPPQQPPAPTLKSIIGSYKDSLFTEVDDRYKLDKINEEGSFVANINAQEQIITRLLSGNVVSLSISNSLADLERALEEQQGKYNNLLLTIRSPRYSKIDVQYRPCYSYHDSAYILSVIQEELKEKSRENGSIAQEQLLEKAPQLVTDVQAYVAVKHAEWLKKLEEAWAAKYTEALRELEKQSVESLGKIRGLIDQKNEEQKQEKDRRRIELRFNRKLQEIFEMDYFAELTFQGFMTLPDEDNGHPYYRNLLDEYAKDGYQKLKGRIAQEKELRSVWLPVINKMKEIERFLRKKVLNSDFNVDDESLSEQIRSAIKLFIDPVRSLEDGYVTELYVAEIRRLEVLQNGYCIDKLKEEGTKLELLFDRLQKEVRAVNAAAESKRKLEAAVALKLHEQQAAEQLARESLLRPFLDVFKQDKQLSKEELQAARARILELQQTTYLEKKDASNTEVEWHYVDDNWVVQKITILDYVFYFQNEQIELETVLGRRERLSPGSPIQLFKEQLEQKLTIPFVKDAQNSYVLKEEIMLLEQVIFHMAKDKEELSALLTTERKNYLTVPATKRNAESIKHALPSRATFINNALEHLKVVEGIVTTCNNSGPYDFRPFTQKFLDKIKKRQLGLEGLLLQIKAEQGSSGKPSKAAAQASQ